MPDKNLPLKKHLISVVQDPDAIRLSAALSAFSPFKVLRVGSYELRHANMLAWLLDPAESHGFGDSFLRSFLSRALRDHPVLEQFELSASGAATVSREVTVRALQKRNINSSLETLESDRIPRGRRLDILIEGEGWLVAIEVKIFSGEVKNQLADYCMAIKESCADSSLYGLIYLTLDEGDKPSIEEWTAATWDENVVLPLQEVLDAHCTSSMPPGSAGSFIDSYLETLRDLSGSGGESDRLASVIAGKYGDQLADIRKALSGNGQADSVAVSDLRKIWRRHAGLLRTVMKHVESRLAKRAKHILALLREPDLDFEVLV